MNENDNTEPTSRRPDLDEAHVHKDAHGFVEGLEFLGRGVLLAYRATKTALSRLLGWMLSDPRRSLVGLGVLASVLLLIAIFANKEAPVVKRPVLPDHFTYTVVSGDNPSVIAARFGVELEDLVRENLTLFAAHAAACQDRQVGANYLKGQLVDGGKRRGSFCTVTKQDGVEVALDTLRPGDQLAIACGADTTNFPECQALVANNVR